MSKNCLNEPNKVTEQPRWTSKVYQLLRKIIIYTIQQMENKKANGEEDIPTDIVKLFAKQHIYVIQELFFCHIQNRGNTKRHAFIYFYPYSENAQYKKMRSI